MVHAEEEELDGLSLAQVEAELAREKERLAALRTAVPAARVRAKEAVADVRHCLAELRRAAADAADATVAGGGVPGGEAERARVADLVEEYATLDEARRYRALLAQVAEWQAAAAASLKERPVAAVEPFLRLVAAKRALAATPCRDLLAKVSAAVETLASGLRDFLLERLKRALRAAKWPAEVDAAALDGKVASELREAIRSLASYESGEDDAGAPGGQSMLVFDVLLAPLLVRFRHHFMGDRPTNQVDKPEWYLSHVLGMVRMHTPFLVDFVQPIVDELGFGTIDVRSEVIRRLLVAVGERIAMDMDALMAEPRLLVHTINECMAVEETLRSDAFMYHPDFPGCMVFFTEHEDVFDAWVAMEKQTAVGEFNKMLEENAGSGSGPWDAAFADVQEAVDDADMDLRPTRAAHSLVTLLDVLGQRFAVLAEPRLQARFANEIVLALLDTFCNEVLVADMTWTSTVGARGPTAAQLERFCSFLNAVQYVQQTIYEWGDSVLYLEIHLWCSRERGVGDVDALQSNFFSEAVQMYQQVYEKLVGNVIGVIVRSLVRPVAAYVRRISTTQMADAVDAERMAVSAEMWPPVTDLRTRIEAVQRGLPAQMFAHFWKDLAYALSDELVSTIVCGHSFSRAGALQFAFDVNAVTDVFRVYTSRPEIYFALLLQSCTLFSASTKFVQQTSQVVGPAPGSLLADVQSRARGIIDEATTVLLDPSKLVREREELGKRAVSMLGDATLSLRFLGGSLAGTLVGAAGSALSNVRAMGGDDGGAAAAGDDDDDDDDAGEDGGDAPGSILDRLLSRGQGARAVDPESPAAKHLAANGLDALTPELAASICARRTDVVVKKQ